MKRKSNTPIPVDLSRVPVRPVRDPAECAEWDRLMDHHHYLGFGCLIGGGVRYVVQDAAGSPCSAGTGGTEVHTGAVDGLDAGAAVPPPAAGRERHTLPRPARRTGSEPGVARPVPFAAPAVGGHAGGDRTSGASGGDVRGPEAVRGHLPAGGEPDGARPHARTNGGWEEHGRPKRVFVRAPAPEARPALAGAEDPAPTAIAEFAARMTQRQPAAVRLRRTGSPRRTTGPADRTRRAFR